VCMRCPVRSECAAHALAGREPYGVCGVAPAAWKDRSAWWRWSRADLMRRARRSHSP
ncbi:WhiB family transcriptional regulator, partial [Streptomyces sp. NPDC059152]|uniref:WhiB family transcriptional regulator n=1 Tax=Streptomyces sp. NPDC059152 TaxID=3346742 RepID=UPI0036CD77DE